MKFGGNQMFGAHKPSATYYVLEDGDAKTGFYFASPEDIIISKLQWYELGGKVSERQWLDVIGVIKVQGDSLDKSYLQVWSKKLGIFELLKNAFNKVSFFL